MKKNLNHRITKPLSKEDALELNTKIPTGAEVFFDGKFFKLNEKKTGYLAWSEILNQWILWLHEKPTPENSISITEIQKKAQ